MSAAARAQPAPPSMGRVLVRPRWLAVLALALVIASIFAWLGRWQLESAFLSLEHGQNAAQDALQPPVGLGELAQPQERVADAAVGRQVTFEGVVDARDFDVVADRLQGELLGYWVIGHVGVTDDEAGASASSTAAPGLAVAVGWTEDEASARELASQLQDASGGGELELSGRLEYGQAPQVNRGEDPQALTAMAPTHLINRWAEPAAENYGVYVSLDEASMQAVLGSSVGAEAIQAITPQALEAPQLNWLNIFYAIEWALFAGFAIFMWWRLARDEFEKERQAAAQAPSALAEQARRDRLKAMLAERTRGEGVRLD
ncbi:SURF1 family protein [Pseudoclavibacter helvolus]|uniref:SURF1 family protein n=1 Tax=Pseudoclavibacter helvolus TaxID=255205 RepID=UPI003C727A02